MSIPVIPFGYDTSTKPKGKQMDKTMAGVAIGYVLFIVLVWALIGIGWVYNLIALLGDTAASTGETIARAIGILVPPFGAILGWFF